MDRLFSVITGCVLITLLLCSRNNYAQVIAPGYNYESWTIEDGLPTNGISGIGTLGDGYIWLSTFDGLVRFNGIVRSSGELFTPYNKSNTDGFSTNRLMGMSVPPSNNEFFLQTQIISGSHNIIHFKDGIFKSYGVEEGITGTTKYETFDLEGNYWTLNDSKLLQFEDGEFVQYYSNIDFQHVVEIKIKSENEILFLKEGQVFSILNGELKELDSINGQENSNFRDIGIGRNGTFYAARRDDFFIIDIDSVQQIDIPYPDSLLPPRLVIEDPNNPDRVFIDLDLGYHSVYYKGEFQLIPSTLIDSESEELLNFELIGSDGNPNEGWSLVVYYIFHNGRSVFERTDQGLLRTLILDQDNLWLVDDRTLYHITPSSFYSYTEQNSGVYNVYPIFEDHEGTIWAGNLTESVFRKPSEKPFELFNDHMPDMSYNRIFSILEDDKNNIWFGHKTGVFLWDRKSPAKSLPTPFDGTIAEVRALFQDSSGLIWAGSERGIYSMNAQKEWSSHPVLKFDRQPGIRTIFEDLDGTMWFGTNGEGLLYRDSISGEINEFEGNDRLSDTIVRSFYQDSDGIYWVGMEGGGLNRIERQGNEFKVTHYNKDNGLFGGVIHSILEDDNERFWMSCNQGIFWVPKSELNALARGEIVQVASTVYDETDGLPATEANGGMQSTAIKTSNGEFWFSMVDGIAVINPNSVNDENLKLTTRVEALITSDTRLEWVSGSLELEKDQRDLQINYVGYSYTIKPENIQFRYRLIGYDEDWIPAGNRTEAFFTGVPAGDYTFEVQASVFGAAWENNEARMVFSIAPHFWETWAFRILSAFFLVGLIFFGYRVRVRALEENERKLSEKVDEQTHQLKEQAERLQELDKAKSRFFANVTHEFRTPLTLTIGPLEDMRKALSGPNKETDPQKVDLALRNSKRLLKLVNQILDISKLESGSMELHLSKVNIISLLDQLCLAFSGLAERKRIKFSHDFPKQEIYLYADLDMMEKVFVNLLSNAFKFTLQDGEIKMLIEENEDDICIKVSDSGPGIEADSLSKIFERFYQTNESRTVGQAGTGIGLSLTKELVELHHGSISVESYPGKGSVFIVLLKKGREHFGDEEFHGTSMVLSSDLNHQNIEETAAFVDESEEESIKDSDDQTTILIIDDNAEIRTYLKEHLSEKYRILEANNGLVGLEKANEHLPDIIICDVMMPKMDGYKFCSELKSNPETDFIPVILLTAKAEQADKLEGLGLGADDYMIKPFDVEEVKARANNLIESRKTLKKRFSGTNGVSISPEQSEMASVDQEFLDKLKDVLESNIDDEEFNIQQLTDIMAMSRSSLYRKVDELLAKSPTKLIIDFRLEKAHHLLSQKAGTVSEIAYSVGFKSIAHFSRSFKAKYEQTPRAFLNQSSNPA